jgi:hypothetical protein
MDIRRLTTNPDKDENGIWLSFDDAEFKIASSHSRRYRDALAAQVRKIPQHARQSIAKIDEATIAAMAKGVLLDFRGIEENGQPLENTEANRVKLLSIPTIREWVAEQSQTLANFQQEALAEDVQDMKSVPPLEA